MAKRASRNRSEGSHRPKSSQRAIEYYQLGRALNRCLFMRICRLALPSPLRSLQNASQRAFEAASAAIPPAKRSVVEGCARRVLAQLGGVDTAEFRERYAALAPRLLSESPELSEDRDSLGELAAELEARCGSAWDDLIQRCRRALRTENRPAFELGLAVDQFFCPLQPEPIVRRAIQGHLDQFGRASVGWHPAPVLDYPSSELVEGYLTTDARWERITAGRVSGQSHRDRDHYERSVHRMTAAVEAVVRTYRVGARRRLSSEVVAAAPLGRIAWLTQVWLCALTSITSEDLQHLAAVGPEEGLWANPSWRLAGRGSELLVRMKSRNTATLFSMLLRSSTRSVTREQGVRQFGSESNWQKAKQLLADQIAPFGLEIASEYGIGYRLNDRVGPQSNSPR
jgi:hypothetical protein